MFIKAIKRYITPSLFVTSALFLSYCGYQYGRYSYERGKLAGVSSVQKEVKAARAKIALMEKLARETEAKYEAAAKRASREYQIVKAAAEEKRNTQYVEVQKIVEKPVYLNSCIGDDGLRELNRSIRGE